MRTKLAVVCSGVVLLLWMLNPTLRDFQEFAPDARAVVNYVGDRNLGTSVYDDISYKRGRNFMLWSTYRVDFTVSGPEVVRYSLIYTGFGKNFFFRGHEKKW